MAIIDTTVKEILDFWLEEGFTHRLTTDSSIILKKGKYRILVGAYSGLFDILYWNNKYQLYEKIATYRYGDILETYAKYQEHFEEATKNSFWHKLFRRSK